MQDFLGSIVMVDDINFALQYTPTHKVVYIGEIQQQNKHLPLIELSVLLPPYQALDADINGDINSYNQIYYDYLTRMEQCYDAFATIIVSAYKGVNILLYVENAELSHKKFLIDYMRARFGIQIGSATTPFGIDPRFEMLIRHIAYSYLDGFISFDYYTDALAASPINDIGTSIFELDQMLIFSNAVGQISRQQNVPPNYVYNYINEVIQKKRMLIEAFQNKGPVIIWDKKKEEKKDADNGSTRRTTVRHSKSKKVRTHSKRV